MIQHSQKHVTGNLLYLTTIAIFFSGVAATTLQLSYGFTATPLSNAVNGFVFTSLVFSMTSAVNSLLGLTWKESI